MVLSIHGNSQIPILSGFDCLYFTTVILVLIKIQWELEIICLIFVLHITSLVVFVTPMGKYMGERPRS